MKLRHTSDITCQTHGSNNLLIAVWSHGD